MWTLLRNKLKDIRTLSALFKAAEQVARANGAERPGSEHLVLASLAMPDGTARRALAGLGATPEMFGAAIRSQFIAALSHAGLEMPTPAGAELPGNQRIASPSKLYRATASGQSLVQRLASTVKARSGRPLLAADILVAAAEEEFSIAARSFRVLGITPQQLVHAAGREIAQCHHGAAKA